MSLETIKALVTEIAGIDNRGTGTPGEKKAAGIVCDKMEALGLDPTTQTFQAPKIYGHALSIFLLVALLGLSIGFAYPLLGAILVGLSYWVLARIFNIEGSAWTMLVPCGESTNVIGRLSAPAAKRTIVFSAHIDAGQTGLMFHPAVKRLFARFQKDEKSVQGPMFLPSVVLLASAVLLLMRFLGASGGLLDALQIIALFLITLTLAVILQWISSPIAPGAIDNASGLAAMLEAAAKLKQEPLKDTDIYFVATGAEETGMIGMRHFTDTHQSMLSSAPAYFINFESVGGGTLKVVEEEGELGRFRYPPFMIGFAQYVAKKHGFGELPTVNLLAATDTIVTARQAKQTLCLIALQNDGVPPNYHEMSDTADRVDYKITLRAADLAVAVVHELENEGV